MSTQRRTSASRAILWVAFAAWLVLPGCGSEYGLTGSHPVAPATQDGPTFALAPSVTSPDGALAPGSDGTGWTLVATGWVTPIAAAKVEGSRYSLKFLRGSVAQRQFISIRERDPKVVDVEFGPHGTQFLVPVEVTFDYKGSANDPESANYNGTEPAVYWYDPSAQAWQVVPSTADKKVKKITFYVEHFSRYAMADGTEDGEWQWTRTGKDLDRPTGENPTN